MKRVILILTLICLAMPVRGDTFRVRRNSNDFGPVFNVKNYGAVGDGVANDVLALQAASTACAAAGGGVIYAPEGTYLASQWTVGSKCTLQGEGIDATVFTCPASEHNACIHGSSSVKLATNASNYGNPVQSVTFRDFTLNGNGTARQADAGLGTGYVRGLVVAHNSEKILVERVRFVDGGSRALEVNPSRQVSVINSICENSSHTVGMEGDCLHVGNPCNNGVREPPTWCDTAAEIDACRDVKYIGNTVMRQGDVAISAQFCSHVVIADNTIAGDESFSCAVNADCGPGGTCTATLCTPTADEGGIEGFGSSHVRVANNMIYKVKNLPITTQTFTDTFGHVWSPTDWEVRGNQIWRDTVNASALNASIFMSGTSPFTFKNLIIADNAIHDSPVAGILLDTNIEGFSVTGNVLYRTYTSGTGVNTEAGIVISNTTASQVRGGIVSGNVIRGEESGVKMGTGVLQQWTGDASTVSILDNYIQYAKTQPYYIRGGALLRSEMPTSVDIAVAQLLAGAVIANPRRGSRVYCPNCFYDPVTGVCAAAGVGAAVGRWADKRSIVAGEWCCETGMSQVAGTLLTLCG